MPKAPKRSIGQVLNVLKPEFPDISISKIRYLESEGLLSPERAPSGYRKYSADDIERLTYILRVQRDNYLPLKVIRENLEVMDSGGEVPEPIAPEDTVPEDKKAQVAQARSEKNSKKQPLKLSRQELLQVSGLSEATLMELERHRMVLPRRGSVYFGRDALTICVVARKLAGYGMDTRHLRAIKQSAEREAGMIEQAARPMIMKSSEPRKTVSEVSQLVVHAHAAMIYAMLER